MSSFAEARITQLNAPVWDGLWGKGDSMARGGRLSDTTIRKARGPAVLYDGDGLFLRVGRANAKGECSKSWVLRYQLNGERHDVGLGRYPLFGLAEARQRAQDCRRKRLDGIDPIEAKRTALQRQQLDAAKAMTPLR